MSVFKKNFLPSQSQPWARQVEDKLTDVEARFKAEIINNRTRDEQLQASYNRLDKAVQAVTVTANTANAAATTANNALNGLISLASDGSSYNVKANNITAGNVTGLNITGGTLATSGAQHVEISGTSAKFFDTAGYQFGQVSVEGSSVTNSAELRLFTPQSEISLGNGAVGISSNGPVVIDGGNGLQVTGGPFTVSSGGANIGGGLQVGVINSTGTSNFTTGNFSGSLVRTALAGGGTTGASFNNDGALQRTTSSQRYKTDINPLQINVNELYGLEPKTFRRIEEVEELGEAARVYPGFIAEELAGTSLDKFVFYSKDEDGNDRPEGIHYAELTGALLLAIKDLNARIQELESR